MRADERRLDEIRREVGAQGSVSAAAASTAGGSLPLRGTNGARSRDPVGYYGRPVIKPPPWTWEVPLYLFVGGVAGASAVLALASKVGGANGTESGMTSSALGMAVLGSLASAFLLVSDLGRPTRFLNMLRVFKWRSPMSVGAWLLTAFGGLASTALAVERAGISGAGVSGAPWAPVAWTLSGAAALLGALLATYTGVLLAITVVPAWRSHAVLLPVHFGVAALGSAAAALELLGFRLDSLHALGLVTASAETVLWLWPELRTQGAADRALRAGRSGMLMRLAGALTGPGALVLRLAGWRSLAAALFLAGALLSRFAWMAAGRASARDPQAAL